MLFKAYIPAIVVTPPHLSPQNVPRGTFINEFLLHNSLIINKCIIIKVYMIAVETFNYIYQ
jgi:hypothetical protein